VATEGLQPWELYSTLALPTSLPHYLGHRGLP